MNKFKIHFHPIHILAFFLPFFLVAVPSFYELYLHETATNQILVVHKLSADLTMRSYVLISCISVLLGLTCGLISLFFVFSTQSISTAIKDHKLKTRS
jgi:hypothetical protein